MDGFAKKLNWIISSLYGFEVFKESSTKSQLDPQDSKVVDDNKASKMARRSSSRSCSFAVNRSASAVVDCEAFQDKFYLEENNFDANKNSTLGSASFYGLPSSSYDQSDFRLANSLMDRASQSPDEDKAAENYRSKSPFCACYQKDAKHEDEKVDLSSKLDVFRRRVIELEHKWDLLLLAAHKSKKEPRSGRSCDASSAALVSVTDVPTEDEPTEQLKTESSLLCFDDKMASLILKIESTSIRKYDGSKTTARNHQETRTENVTADDKLVAIRPVIPEPRRDVKRALLPKNAAEAIADLCHSPHVRKFRAFVIPRKNIKMLEKERKEKHFEVPKSIDDKAESKKLERELKTAKNNILKEEKILEKERKEKHFEIPKSTDDKAENKKLERELKTAKNNILKEEGCKRY